METIGEYLELEILKLRRLNRELQEAAARVCNVRYSDAEWDELNRAIGELIGILQKQGFVFDNPRIGHA